MEAGSAEADEVLMQFGRELDAKCEIFSAAKEDAEEFHRLWNQGARPEGFTFGMWEVEEAEYWRAISVGPFLTSDRCVLHEGSAREARIPTTRCEQWPF